jgi:hypothetical protein
MPPFISKMAQDVNKYKGPVLATCGGVALAYAWLKSYGIQQRKTRNKEVFLAKDSEGHVAGPKTRDKAAVDAKFFQQILRMIKVIVPTPSPRNSHTWSWLRLHCSPELIVTFG